MPGVDHLAADLEFVARNLKQAGETDLRKELQAAVTRAAQPVPEAIRGGLIPRLPNPYARVFGADLRVTVSKRYGARDPGVTVRATTRSGKRRKLRRLDDGALEHPLYGNRRFWFRQAVGPGWFTTPAREAAGRAREEILAALDRVSVKAARKG